MRQRTQMYLDRIEAYDKNGPMINAVITINPSRLWMPARCKGEAGAKVMADHSLDAIVHKSVDHTPTFITDGINPPFINQKGVPHLNTYLIYAAREWEVRLMPLS